MLPSSHRTAWNPRSKTFTAALALVLLATPVIGCGGGGASQAAGHVAQRDISAQAARAARQAARTATRDIPRTPAIDSADSASSRARTKIERLASEGNDYRQAACRSANAHAFAQSTPPEQAYSATVAAAGLLVPYAAFVEIWTNVAQLSDGDTDAVVSLACSG
jgi:D-alanyl-D-alanine carboxypeptidase